MFIEGVRYVEYVSKKDGRKVSGWEVYYSGLLAGGYGRLCGKEWINPQKANGFFDQFKSLEDCIGLEFDFIMQPYGNKFVVGGLRLV